MSSGRRSTLAYVASPFGFLMSGSILLPRYCGILCQLPLCYAAAITKLEIWIDPIRDFPLDLLALCSELTSLPLQPDGHFEWPIITQAELAELDLFHARASRMSEILRLHSRGSTLLDRVAFLRLENIRITSSGPKEDSEAAATIDSSVHTKIRRFLDQLREQGLRFVTFQ